MGYTDNEVIDFMKDNDVKFFKLSFSDIFGNRKAISVFADEAERVFKDGLSFDPLGDLGFMGRKDILYLRPDPSTFSVLPWRPQSGKVATLFCRLTEKDGTPLPCDGTVLLEKTEERLRKLGVTVSSGAECEFYICKLSDSGEPTKQPYDYGSYLDAAPKDRCENIRRELVLNLESLGVSPVSSYHAHGPGQNAVGFKSVSLSQCARDILLTSSAIGNVTVKNGLSSTHSPKPFDSEPGNGFRILFTLKANAGAPFSTEAVVDSFIEGVLTRLSEAVLITNPSSESYKRLSADNAPKYIGWSENWLKQAVSVRRLPTGTDIVVSSPDCACNPGLAIALVVNAGIDGIEKGLKLRAPIEKEKKSKLLPQSAEEAVAIAEKSEWLHSILPREVIECFISTALRFKGA